MGKNATGSVSKHLVYACENGIIPWDWIVDETREAEPIPTWKTPEAIIKSAIGLYRKDYWSDQPIRLEVWSEKGAIRGTLAPVLEEHYVTFRVMHGYDIVTAIYEIARESAQLDRPLIVFYVGDFDCSGLRMSEVDIPERRKRYGGAVTTDRMALTEDDGASLPSFEAKGNDSCYEWFTKRHGHRCWEVDARSPLILRKRLEDRIGDFIDIGKWIRMIEVEAVKRASMERHFHEVAGILSAGAKYPEGDREP